MAGRDVFCLIKTKNEEKKLLGPQNMAKCVKISRKYVPSFKMGKKPTSNFIQFCLNSGIDIADRPGFPKQVANISVTVPYGGN